MDEHDLEGFSLSGTNLPRIGKPFFFSFILQRYMVHRSPRLGFAIPNTDVTAVDFFPRKQFMKLSASEDQQTEGKSHLLI